MYVSHESLEKNSINDILNITDYVASTPVVKKIINKVEEKYEYRPKHIRGSGVLREGYCDKCAKWYKLKTSSYWYHMNYKHGINSNGVKYPDPAIRRFNDHNEAFCNLCNKWVSLGKSKKTYKFNWYRHWQKNHVADVKNKK
ncbi:Meiotic expression up-regulated protein 26 [Dictyocoela muelleri]|nr:Meiotic expression up-regulated protein 26 [Dictyocoela muelleri]